MGQNNMLISEINIETKNWTSRVTVTEDIPVMTCINGSKLKRYILTDTQGNEIAATIFSDHIAFVTPLLNLFNVYDITNAKVKPVAHKFRITTSQYHWVLQRDTFIRPVPAERPTLHYLLSRLTPFSLISTKKVVDANNIDIMRIITSVEHSTVANTFNGLKNIQRFTLVDMEKIPIHLTLWEDMAQTQGPILAEAARSLSVVVAKRLALSTNRGCALSSKNSSSFAIDPPIEQAIHFKSWLKSRTTDELQQLLNAHSITVSKELLTRGHMQLHTVAEINNETKYGEYWVRGLLQISEEDQKLFYLWCKKCNSKISAGEEGIDYTCYNCQNEGVTAARPLVLMDITDATSTMKVVTIAKVAENILQTTETHVSSLTNLGESYDLNTIRSEFQDKVFLMQIRRNSTRENESQRKPLLVAYFEDEDFAATTNVIGDSSYGHSPVSPLKRQMSKIIIDPSSSARKRLTMTKGGDDGNEGTSK